MSSRGNVTGLISLFIWRTAKNNPKVREKFDAISAEHMMCVVVKFPIFNFRTDPTGLKLECHHQPLEGTWNGQQLVTKLISHLWCEIQSSTRGAENITVGWTFSPRNELRSWARGGRVLKLMNYLTLSSQSSARALEAGVWICPSCARAFLETKLSHEVGQSFQPYANFLGQKFPRHTHPGACVPKEGHVWRKGSAEKKKL